MLESIWVVAFSCLWFWVKLFAICAQLYKEVGLVLLTESPLTRGWWKKVKLIERNAVIAHNKIAAFVVCCKQLTINIDLNPRSFKIDWRNAMASSQSSWNVMIRQWTWLKLDALFSILLLKPYICSRHVSTIWLVAGLQPKLFLSRWYMFTFSF